MSSVFVLLVLACQGGEDPQVTGGIVRPPLAHFPSRTLVDDDGFIDLGAVELPQPKGGTPVPVERVSHRRGFSPVQTVVIDLGVPLDPASLPGFDALGEAGSVQLWDLDAGERVPVFAELDAFPDNLEVPTLLVRPLAPMTPGHEVAVVLSSAVRTSDGVALEPVDWWADRLAGHAPAGAEAEIGQARDTHDRLVDLGVDDQILSFSFPIDDPRAPLQMMLSDLETPDAWEWEAVRVDDEGDAVPEGIWKRLEGSFSGQSWLEDDVQFSLDAEGLPQSQGAIDVDLWVYMPDALKEAEPGTAPVWLFGHGIFADADEYLNQDGDPSGVIDLANRAGALVVATEWRGLTADDRLVGVEVGNDFGVIPTLTDKLAQGVANNAALVKLVTEGGLLDDPDLEGVADGSRVFYYGISLGGIQGATLFASSGLLEAGVFHVGGSSWSTMLERSSQWSVFETLVLYGVPSARDRQLLYAASQLFWDVSESATWTDELRGQPVLWQEAIHDEQVANLTTESLARGVGATLLSPSATTPWGLESGEAPLSGPVLAQFDPLTEVVHLTNRPSEVTGAHDAPRGWEGTKLQTLRFLDPDDPGVVEHYCGEMVCTADNDGS